METSLSELRHQVNPQQAELLSLIWRHKTSTDGWLPARVLHKSAGGKPLIRPLLSSLGGTVVFEIDDSGTTKYGLTLLGVLLSSDGQRLEDLIVHYLALARQMAFEEPERTHIHSKEVSTALGISGVNLTELGTLLFLGPFLAGGSFSREEWNAGIPRNIEDIPEDLATYVASVAVEGFDPAVPISQGERQAYQSQARFALGRPRVGILSPVSLPSQGVHNLGDPARSGDSGERFSLSMPGTFETGLESYRTRRVLGEGGSGRVFLVQDSKGSEFAVKCLYPELVSTQKLGRFKNELSFSQKNTHPNILTVIDHGFLPMGEAKAPFYVMAFYGSTLRKQLAEGVRAERAYELFIRILEGVEEAHRRGIWHRDLKPENVLIDPAASSLVVADFGIAHFSEDDLYTAVETKQIERLANFQYAAPEQRVRGRPVNQLADIYALGLILNEMFTGEVPLGTGFRTVSQAAPAFSYLDGIVDRMIRQSPKQRPASINEIRLELTLGQQPSATRTGLTTVLPPLERRLEIPQTYRAEVDCSGRLEDRANDTVLSISAGLSFSIAIPAAEKTRALDYLANFRPQWGPTRRRVLLHTILLFILIRDQMRKLDVAVIDPEYPGYEAEIKNTLLHLLRSSGAQVRKQQIVFERIDRRSPARLMASRVYRGMADPDHLIGARQVSDILAGERIGA